MTLNAGDNVGNLDHLYIAGKTVKWYCLSGKYWVGQEVHTFGFCHTLYGKIQTNFLANPIVQQFLLKLRMDLPFDSAIPLYIYPEK